jgi:exosome complex component RRP46
VLENPSVADIHSAKSLHVFAFTSHRELVLSESQGEFAFEEWEAVCAQAERICCGEAGVQDADAMVDRDEVDKKDMLQFVETALQEKVGRDLQWRNS